MLETRIRVRFGECDGLGHVNNAVYFTYMEEARTEMFRWFNPELDLRAWNLIVAGARCDFLKQVGFSEELVVFTWISRVGNSSFTVEHALRNAKGDWTARGQAAMLAFDFAQERPVPLWEDVRLRLAEHPSGPAGAPSLRE